MSGLAHRVAVLSGASSGVGKALALGLAREGTTLGLIGRNIQSLEAVAADAREGGAPRVVCYCADLARDHDIEAVVTDLERDFRHVDVLIHSAGVLTPGFLDTALVADFDRQYYVNVRAPYLLTQSLLSQLRASQGQVVLINSSVGLQAKAMVGQYAATKHALKAMADSLRDEVNEDGIRVLSAYLGRTASPMQQALHAQEGRPYNPDNLIQPDDVAAVVLNVLVLPRSAEVTDISIRPMRKLS